jgi:succinate dehydrogenase / fumarate reductase iron-sulfur subunit
MNTITVKVRRGTKDSNRLVSYEVPFEKGQSVLGVLQFIYEYLEPGLGFLSSCRIGLCTSCLVRVNGKVVRSCTTLAQEDMVIEPYKASLVVRDLIAELPQLSREKGSVQEGLPISEESDI